MGQIEVDMEKFKAKEPLPKCKNCGKLARPNILMFGDYGWIGDRTEKQRERFEESIGRKKFKICVVEIGAGESVYTVRALGEHFLYRERASLVRINPGKEFGNDDVIHLQVGALDGLVKLNEALEEIN